MKSEVNLLKLKSRLSYIYDKASKIEFFLGELWDGKMKKKI